MTFFLVLMRRVSCTELGIAGDTVCLDEANSLWESVWSARECLQAGDYYKINSLYVTLKEDLVVHEYNKTLQSRDLFQSRQSRETGMINTPGLYLLKGSSIDYTLCISSEGSTQLEGRLYVFNDRKKFYAYIDESDDGDHTSVYYMDFIMGTNNQSVCSQMTFAVPEAAYHYIAAKTPGGVLYNFTATIRSLYLNHTDYLPHCQISGSDSCDLKIPQSFTDKKYVLLAYIHPVLPYAPEPLSTHLCIERKGRWIVPVILGVLSGLLIIILFSVATLHLYKHCSNRQRNGYIAIDTDIQGS